MWKMRVVRKPRTAKQRSSPVLDLVAIAIVSVITFIFAVVFEAFEKVFYWTQQYEAYEVDEFLTVGFILPVAFGIYAWRRWSDFRRALQESERANEQLNEVLREKEILLKEVHHRTKNSLAIAASLIRMSENDTTEEISLSEIASRIDSIAEVHRSLQQSRSYDKVDLREYLGRVVGSSLTYTPDVSIENEVESVSVPTKTAVNIGLALNEIASNAAKYGFSTEKPRVFRIASHVNGSEFVLSASNSGNSLPDGITLDEPRTLGLQLIKMLVEQLGGTATLEATPQARVVFRIPDIES